MSHVTGRDTTTASIGQRVDLYAAERGEQVATVRKRIQRGQLVGYKGADHRWYVLPDDATDATHDRTHDATGQDRTRDRRQESVASVVVNPNARAQLEAIRDEWLQPLVETIARQAEQIGRLQAERDGATSQLLAKDQTIAAREQALAADALTIAELRRRAEVAEAQLARRLEADQARILRQAEAEQARQQAEEAAHAAQEAPGTPEAPGEGQDSRPQRMGACAPLVGDTLEGVKDFMVTLVLARTNPGAISVARNALRRV